jgi:hypothetical protein
MLIVRVDPLHRSNLHPTSVFCLKKKQRISFDERTDMTWCSVHSSVVVAAVMSPTLSPTFTRMQNLMKTLKQMYHSQGMQKVFSCLILQQQTCYFVVTSRQRAFLATARHDEVLRLLAKTNKRNKPICFY